MGLFRKVKVALKFIFLLKRFPIPCQKVKHTHSSTVHLKLFLTVDLGMRKEMRIDIVSASPFSSETALNFKAESLLPFQIYRVSANSVGSAVQQRKAAVGMCKLCFQRDAGI